MGESGEGGESQGRVGAPYTLGAIHVIPRAAGVELYFPPWRMARPALLLAAFGMACIFIGVAAVLGLVRATGGAATGMLALAFAGVFALPLCLLGQFFVATALWAGANSLRVDVSEAGVVTVRRWCGLRVARRTLLRDEIASIDSRPAARYIGALRAARYFRLVARARAPAVAPLLIADTLLGPDMTDAVRRIFIEALAVPGLAAAGSQAHRPAADAA